MNEVRNGVPLLAKLVMMSLAVVVGTYIIPGVHIDSVITAILLSVVLSLLNVLLKPLLVLLTLPITILTLGLFLVVINALIILLAAEIVPGFSVDGFWWAVLFSIILSLVISVLEAIQQAATGQNNQD